MMSSIGKSLTFAVTSMAFRSRATAAMSASVAVRVMPCRDFSEVGVIDQEIGI